MYLLLMLVIQIIQGLAIYALYKWWKEAQLERKVAEEMIQ